MTLFHQFFDSSAARWPDNEALRWHGQGMSYSRLQRRSQSLAAALRLRGVGAGERVVSYLQNRPEVIELALACSRLGAIHVPANAMLRARQLAHVLKDSGATVLLASRLSVPVIAEALAGDDAVRQVLWCDLPEDPATLPAGLRDLSRDYEPLCLGPVGEAAVTGVIEDDPAALLYTSGSTGRAKGVVVSHRNLVSGAHIVAGYLHNAMADRILVALPLSFDYGFSQVSTAFSVGACAVLTHFVLPAGLLQELVTERITALAGVPTMWMHLAAVQWPQQAAANLRYITNSGGALPVAVIQSLQQRLPGTSIYCMYGLTEAFRSTYLDPAELPRRAGSIGKAIAGQQVTVRRSDGSLCDPGEVGELVHRGSLVTLGYWNHEALTAHRFRPVPHQLTQLKRDDIGVWSGDLARCDAEGFLYFIGRADEMIKSSGYRISPAEVEEVVMELPQIVECAAIGMADDALGQRVVVAVVAHQAAADLPEKVRYHCRVQLPAYMVPAQVQVMAALPRNANGKCDRGALAQMLRELTLAQSQVAR